MDACILQGSAKRRGCLLSHSQAEPGRELTQPSPCLLAEPCKHNIVSFQCHIRQMTWCSDGLVRRKYLCLSTQAWNYPNLNLYRMSRGTVHQSILQVKTLFTCHYVPLSCNAHCFLTGRACCVCSIWLDSPLTLSNQILHTGQA